MIFSPGLFELKLELQFEVTTNLTRTQSPSSVHPGTRDLKLNFQLELPVQFPNSPATIELKPELEFPDLFPNSPATIEQEFQLSRMVSCHQTQIPSPSSVPGTYCLRKMMSQWLHNALSASVSARVKKSQWEKAGISRREKQGRLFPTFSHTGLCYRTWH